MLTESPVRFRCFRYAGPAAVLALGLLAGMGAWFAGHPVEAWAAPQDNDALLEKIKRDLNDRDGQRRAIAMKDLAKLEDPRVLPLLVAGLADEHERVRDTAGQVLVDIKLPDETVGGLLAKDGLRARNPEIRARAARALGLRGWKPAVEPLLGALDDRDNRRDQATRAAAALALGRLAPEGALRDRTVEALKSRATSDEHWLPRAHALEGLGLLQIDGLAELLAQRAESDADKQARLHALRLLETADAEVAVTSAVARLGDQAWEVQVQACEILGRVRRKESIEPLIEALAAADGRLRWDMSQALSHITGLTIGSDASKWRTWWRFNKDAFTVPREGAEAELGGGSATGFYGIPVLTKRPVFVLDLSGGMSRAAPDSEESRADLAKTELKKVIAALENGAVFNVVFFGTDVSALEPRGMLPKNAGVLAKAMQFIDRQQPHGRTNMYDALALALSMEDGDTIFLLTEGAPNEGTFQNKGEILDKIAEVNRFRKVQIHVVQVAEPVKAWRNFTEAMAESTGGMVARHY